VRHKYLVFGGVPEYVKELSFCPPFEQVLGLLKTGLIAMLAARLTSAWDLVCGS